MGDTIHKAHQKYIPITLIMDILIDDVGYLTIAVLYHLNFAPRPTLRFLPVPPHEGHL
jgi:hypothetical protein